MYGEFSNAVLSGQDAPFEWSSFKHMNDLWGPDGKERNFTRVCLATVAHSLASMITFARTAWRPARFAMTIPAGLPRATSKSVG
jgi:hypothetical protein